MLIALQRSDATQVAGFNAWKALGRYVKRGEKGIAIIAPIPLRRTEPLPAGEGADADSSESGLRFKAVYVFDVSQTDGEPLPELAAVTGDPGHYTERLQAVAAERGIAVEYSADFGTAEGRSSGGGIDLAAGLEAAHEFMVLAHEVTHALSHRPGVCRRRETEELRTEAVAGA